MDTFFCVECGEEYNLYYMSPDTNDVCQFCDTTGDYDEDCLDDDDEHGYYSGLKD
jgi:NMD protein affecting ribosome stability and mRNA decay